MSVFFEVPLVFRIKNCHSNQKTTWITRTQHSLQQQQSHCDRIRNNQQIKQISHSNDLIVIVIEVGSSSY